MVGVPGGEGEALAIGGPGHSVDLYVFGQIKGRLGAPLEGCDVDAFVGEKPLEIPDIDLRAVKYAGGERASELTLLVAEHYELAGEPDAAARHLAAAADAETGVAVGAPHELAQQLRARVATVGCQPSDLRPRNR